MKHDPEEEILPHTTILSSTRWGLRTGRTPRERRRLGATKLDGSTRCAADYMAELEIPQSQIGAHWITSSTERDEEPIGAVWINSCVGHELDYPETELDDREYERERREQMRSLMERFERLVPGDDEVEEIATRDKSDRIREILRALGSPKTAIHLILSIVANGAEHTEASDRGFVGLGMSENDGRPLFLAVLSALRESSMARMDALSDHDRVDKQKVSVCWAKFNTFVRDVHGELRRARIILPKPPDRREQFRTLEAWAREHDLNPRERFLREWRVRIVRLAAELKDAGKADDHREPRLVSAFAYAKTGFRLGGFDADAIRRFLKGHSDSEAAAFLTEFEPAWQKANSTPMRQDPLAGKSMLDLAREATERRRRRGY